MKKAVKILIGVVAALATAALVLFIMTRQQTGSIQNEKIAMEQVQDGTYTAEAETVLVKAKASVTVKNHKIEKIDLIKHQCGTGKPAEAEIDDMVENNTYDVDVVSGATMSSKVIQHAVNLALQQGVEE